MTHKYEHPWQSFHVNPTLEEDDERDPLGGCVGLFNACAIMAVFYFASLGVIILIVLKVMK